MFKHSSRPTHPATSPVLWVVPIACAIMAVIGLVASVAEAKPYTPHAQHCFSAEDWGPAPDAIRPCVKLKGNVPAAGLVRFTVSNGGGPVRYRGTIPTPYHSVAGVYIQRVYEDGSFRYCIANHGGRLTCGGVGNLED